MDIEEPIPSDINITQYFTLFISEFLFTFVCGFCEFDSQKAHFKTNFRNFDNFSIFVLRFLTSKFTNVISLLEFAQRKISFMQTDCEKTEYLLTDKFNAYGVYFITLLAMDYTNFNGNLAQLLDIESANYLTKNKVFLYPKVFSKEYNSAIILEILASICSIENHFALRQKGHSNVFYATLIESYSNIVIKFYQETEIQFVDKNKAKNISGELSFKNKSKKIEIVNKDYSRYFSKFILEYLNIKAEERNEKLLISLSNLYEVFSYLIYLLTFIII